MSDHTDKGPKAVAISVGFTVIAGVFVIGRCVARFGLVKNPGPDDYLIIFALVCSIVMTLLIWDGEFHQLGLTSWLTICRTAAWTREAHGYAERRRIRKIVEGEPIRLMM